ncbi:MAG: hypothetical protein LBR53_10525 [Deltaproteobacteria bacterium]|jgi:ribonuclease J|nr:hypothetical protein [Deltaproteobacteria bacterium]
MGELIVHRGTRQIGGCATEIRGGGKRIFIDFGAELPSKDKQPELLAIEGLTHGERDCDGLFFTHIHCDHIGMLPRVLKDVPGYLGEAAKEMLLTQLAYLPEKADLMERVRSLSTYRPAKRVELGGLAVTPFAVDHSVYDSYMFLVETEGKRILHTGDFRTHGFRGKGVMLVLDNCVKRVDILVSEGTSLSRKDADFPTEMALQDEAHKILKSHKHVFLLCSSMNIDRIASFHKRTRAPKMFLCDQYQKEILLKVHDHAKDVVSGGVSLYDFSSLRDASQWNFDLMRQRGFCMPVRAAKHLRTVMDMFQDTGVLVYSMWDGYLEGEYGDDGIARLVDSFPNKIKLHTSGHATPEALRSVAAKVAPEIGIVPIHTENPAGFEKMGLASKIIKLSDGERFPF